MTWNPFTLRRDIADREDIEQKLLKELRDQDDELVRYRVNAEYLNGRLEALQRQLSVLNDCIDDIHVDEAIRTLYTQRMGQTSTVRTGPGEVHVPRAIPVQS